MAELIDDTEDIVPLDLQSARLDLTFLRIMRVIKQFIFDLIGEADDPQVSDNEAREIIRTQMTGAISARQESGARCVAYPPFY